MEQLDNKSKGMTKEQRKEYNKKYYTEHKQAIIADLCQKVKCERCQSEVSKSRLHIHKNTQLCKKRAEKLCFALELLNNIINKGNEDKPKINYDDNIENLKNILQVFPK